MDNDVYDKEDEYDEEEDATTGFIVDVITGALTWIQYHPKSTLIEAYGVSFDNLTRDS